MFCDSLVIMQYKKIPINNVIVNLTSCDSTQAGTVILNLTNQYGCDSIVTINTLFNSSTQTYMIKHICGAGIDYQDTITYITPECDSVVITSFLHHLADTTYSLGYTCIKAQSGIFKTVLSNIWGCDSTHINTIIHNPSDTTYLDKITCDKLQVGKTETLLKNKYNCDSLIVVNTTYVPSDTTYLTKSTCDPANTGTTVETFIDTPCDSVVITDRYLIPPYKIITQKTTCFSDQLESDTLKLQSIEGCDSIIITQYQYLGMQADSLVTDESCLGFGDGGIHCNKKPSKWYTPFRIQS